MMHNHAKMTYFWMQMAQELVFSAANKGKIRFVAGEYLKF